MRWGRESGVGTDAVRGWRMARWWSVGLTRRGGGKMVAVMTILGEETALPRPAADERQRRSGVALTPCLRRRKRGGGVGASGIGGTLLKGSGGEQKTWGGTT
jgi:hypothetical protein